MMRATGDGRDRLLRHDDHNNDNNMKNNNTSVEANTLLTFGQYQIGYCVIIWLLL